MPVSNRDIAAVFEQIADLLELLEDNPYRIRAYRRAARTVDRQARPLADEAAADGKLERLPGIGKDLAGKIREIVGSGRCATLVQLKRRVPAGLEDLLHLPGLGPARVRLLHRELGVTSLAGLRRALDRGRLQTVRGFGAKLESRLREAVTSPATGRRMRRDEAARYAEALVRRFGGLPGVSEAVVAGSYRRGVETVGDIDLLVAARRPAPVVRALTGLDGVAEVLSAGPSRASVRLAGGPQVDLRVVPVGSYGAALHYFTGSKAHNINLRRMAQRKGLRINEYGVFRGERRIAGRSERSVFASLGLPWIPPELREDSGEIQAAMGNRLPQLVERGSLRGDLHLHTAASDGHASLADMAAAAGVAGLEYIACTDHSRYLGEFNGLDAARLARQLGEIDRLNADGAGCTILKSVEVDILEDGSLALPDELLGRLDLVVGAVHSHFNLTRRRQTRRLLAAIDHPHFSILAHPATRLIGRRTALDCDLDAVIRHCAARGCFLELNAQPERLDLDEAGCRLAARHGVLVSIASDAHRPGDFDCLAHGVLQARRGWLGPDAVLNARPLRALRPLLRRTMN